MPLTPPGSPLPVPRSSRFAVILRLATAGLVPRSSRFAVVPRLATAGLVPRSSRFAVVLRLATAGLVPRSSRFALTPRCAMPPAWPSARAVSWRPRLRGSRRPRAPRQGRPPGHRTYGRARLLRRPAHWEPGRTPRDRRSDIRLGPARSGHRRAPVVRATDADHDARRRPRAGVASSPWSSTPPPPWVAPGHRSREVTAVPAATGSAARHHAGAEFYRTRKAGDKTSAAKKSKTVQLMPTIRTKTR